MNLILFGAPGVGKGTQAERLAARLGVPHISTGAIFRAAIGAGQELGLKVKQFLDDGLLVPDELTTAIALESLGRPECARGFILDGFPRNIAQAEALTRAFSESKRPIDRVIYLTAPVDELVARMLGRGRVDDNEEVIRTRLDVYQMETAPVLDFFRHLDLVSEINGVGSMDEVQERILEVLRSEVPSESRAGEL